MIFESPAADVCQNTIDTIVPTHERGRVHSYKASRKPNPREWGSVATPRKTRAKRGLEQLEIHHKMPANQGLVASTAAFACSVFSVRAG